MTNTTEKLDPKDAQQALNSINEMGRTSLKHAMPPSWFGVIIALIVGTLVFVIAASLRDYYVFPIIALPLVLAIRSKSTKAMPRTAISSKKEIISLLALVILFLSLIAGAWLLKGSYGITWAPELSGLIAGLVVLILSIAERRSYMKIISGDKS